MGHFVNSAVTAGPTPAVHAGLNYATGSFTLSETASGSLTISLCNLPGGARVVDAVVAYDNDAVGLGATPGTSVTQIKTNGTAHATLIQSATVSTVVQVFNPTYEAIGYRCTSSSQVVLTFNNLPASGTAATVIAYQVVYDCQQDGD